MNIITILFVVAATFGICHLLDRGYTKKFRGQTQHQSGLSVRPSKRYAVFGLFLVILGVLAIFTGMSGSMVLLLGGVIVLAMGAGLIIYYMTFGLFYDADSFILTTFGKKSITYTFGNIRGQKLYLVQGGTVIVELYMTDGNSVNLQSNMEGVYPFLDHAFAAWCRQTGRVPENCDFHDPSNSLWFPTEEDT